MESSTDMDLYSSPASSPASSPEPMSQEESPCFNKRRFEEELKVMNTVITSKINLLTAYKNEPFFNYEDSRYKEELRSYNETQAQLDKLKKHHMRKLERKAIIREEEEKKIEEELRQLTQFEKKSEEKETQIEMQAKLSKNQRKEAPCLEECGTEPILRKEEIRRFKAIS
ncbi:hypothetical protein NPIL_700981 [Nephila pilipes]|uniref:Uncharacterized protein n=1 Tax=Nephila pilipes TaxID=299642 RepID=A0A8X6MXI3_NEPPI|nr:hypothetical protein NPIL_700981 [Nephila pilipes]